jgi:hypothetical protein
VEPVRTCDPSVSGIQEGRWRPAADGGVCPVIWAHAGPRVTVGVRCDLVVPGPDVAPMWPRVLSAARVCPMVRGPGLGLLRMVHRDFWVRGAIRRNGGGLGVRPTAA